MFYLKHNILLDKKINGENKITVKGIIMVGIDIESSTRFEHYLDEGLKRLFTENEIKYAKEYEDYLQHLTGFFCVKEAFIKALDTDIDYLQIEVLHTETGKPYINQTSYIKKILRQKNIESVDVSISHCKQFSTAVVQANEWQD